MCNKRPASRRLDPRAEGRQFMVNAALTRDDNQMRLLSVLAAVALIALPTAGCSADKTNPAATAEDKAFGEKVRAYLLDHPEVLEEAINKLQQTRAEAADKASGIALAANRAKVERDPRDFVAGNPDGKITVVEYFDYRCPYCKAALGDINKLIADNKDVRFVFKEFPILSPVSERAARAALGAKEQGKYLPVHNALMAEKNLDDAAIDRILTANGVDAAKAKAFGATKAAEAQLTDTNQIAKLTGVTGTPAFVIGDKLISGWDMDALKNEIEAARKAS
jgi:protein-disulfide isomerase